MCTYVYINININIDTRVQDFANELRGERKNLLEMDDVIIRLTRSFGSFRFYLKYINLFGMVEVMIYFATRTDDIPKIDRERLV